MKAFTCSCAVAALIAGASPAWSQAARQSPEASTGDGAFDDIIVTAQKRAENVQDIPKSVQVVGAAELRTQNITDISDLRKVVPSISGTGLSIRGVATAGNTLSVQSKVGIVLDDVPQPTRATLANNLLDIERVEVLPGPQGTLSGRNALGGLINLVTRSPKHVWEGEARVTLTDDHQIQGGAYITGPISETLAFSLSAFDNYFRGLSRNKATGNWANTDTWGVRGKLKFDPSPELSITGTGFYQRSFTRAIGGTAYQVFSYLSLPQDQIFTSFDTNVPARSLAVLKPGVTVGPDNIDFYSEFEGHGTFGTYGGILRGDYDLGGATITSITSYINEKTLGDRAEAFNGFTLVNMNYRPEYDGGAHTFWGTKSTSQEIRVASTGSSPFQYVGGFYYLDNTNIFNYARYVFPVDWLRTFNAKSASVFGRLSYKLETGTTVAGGLRYENDQTSYVWVFNPILATTKTNPNGVVLNFAQTNPYKVSQGSAKADFVNFDLSVQQEIGSNVMLYATFSRAKQAPVYDSEDNVAAGGGSSTTNTVAGTLQTLPQEDVRNFEFGFKSELFDRHLIFNVNFFNGNYSNYQVQTLTFDNTQAAAVPIFKLASVGKVRTRGAEVTLNWVVSENLRINSSLAYTEAKIIDFPGATCYTGQTAATGCMPVGAVGNPFPFANQGNLAGRDLAGAPRWRLVVNPSYDLPIGDGWHFLANASIRYQNKSNNDLLGAPAADVPAATFINAGIGARTDRYSIELFANNLTDKSIETFGTSISGFVAPAATTAIPFPVKTRNLSRDNYRYIGLRLSAKF